MGKSKRKWVSCIGGQNEEVHVLKENETLRRELDEKNRKIIILEEQIRKLENASKNISNELEQTTIIQKCTLAQMGGTCIAEDPSPEKMEESMTLLKTSLEEAFDSLWDLKQTIQYLETEGVQVREENETLRRKVDEKKKEIITLQKQRKKWENTFKNNSIELEQTTIIQNCRNVQMGGTCIMASTDDPSPEKMKEFMTILKTSLEEASDSLRDMKQTIQNLEDTCRKAEEKVGVIETHFSAQNEFLQRNFADVSDNLLTFRTNIENQIKELGMVFSKKSTQTGQIQEDETMMCIARGIQSINEWMNIPKAITAATVPLPAKDLVIMLSEKYKNIPVDLEELLTSKTKGFYAADDTFENNVARWLVKWVKTNSDHTAERLNNELKRLDKIKYKIRGAD